MQAEMLMGGTSLVIEKIVRIIAYGRGRVKRKIGVCEKSSRW